MGRDTAQQLRGRPIGRQNKSTLSFSLSVCGCVPVLRLARPLLLSFVVIVDVVIIIYLEFDLNTSYLNYLVM